MLARLSVCSALAVTSLLVAISTPACAGVLDVASGMPSLRNQGRASVLRSGRVTQGEASRARPCLNLRGGSDSASPNRLQIVFVSAEVAPWSVTGGLGAVCDGLPRAMAKQGHRVMSIAPRYDQYYDAWDTECTAEVPLGDGMTTVRYFHAFKKGVDRVFVDHPLFLEKVWGLTKTKLYGPKWGSDYEDNQLRFSMFCKAALLATEQLSLGGYPYGQDVVFVANDWHAALVPMYLKQAKAAGSGWLNAKCAVLLHNLVFQGRFPLDPKAAQRLHVPQEMVDVMTISQQLKVGRQKEQTKGLKGGEEIANPSVQVLNMLMGAIKNADTVLTVSPGYAREVVSSSAKGAGMETLLAQRGIIGILNGVEDMVDPSNPELGLPVEYDVSSLHLKAKGKRMMQCELGFEQDESIPLFIFMGRLDAQKGVDVMFEAIDRAFQQGLRFQFVTMGSGIEQLETVAADLEERYPHAYRAVLSFKGAEKYKTYAAADFAMMPSRYEPCGLVQMEGMRFGTLPIVAPTGGLADTVKDMKTGLVMEHEIDGDGIVEADVDMLVQNMHRACDLYKNTGNLRQLQGDAMGVSKAYSWANSARQYIDHFIQIGAPTS